MNYCRDCSHWVRTSEKWGYCPLALNGEWFLNRTRDRRYWARHTNSRYHGQPACKTRFLGKDKKMKPDIKKTKAEIEFENCKSHFLTETFKDGKMTTISMNNVDTMAFNSWAFLTQAGFDEVRIRLATPEEVEEWERI